MPKRKKKAPYDATLRFRSFKTLAARIERIVAARGYGDASDVMREGTDFRVREEERRLGLSPIDSEPVRYSKGKKR
ncbi:MAG: hypothetical protein QOE26_2783 [Verrucomicrobiota bacterium]|jgi:hypothetical protein